MILQSKFDIGQTVYHIWRIRNRVFIPCGFCGQTGEISGANGESAYCPICYGKTGKYDYEEEAWSIVESFEIENVRIDHTNSKTKIEYMQTSEGAGTLCQESDLFATHEEAKAECVKRNEGEK